MELTTERIDALRKAQELMDQRDFCPYLELKKLIHSPPDRKHFEDLFVRYYGLNIGGLTPDFRELFFDTLFDTPKVTSKDILTILETLSKVSRTNRKKGGCALQFSFASKLIAIHDESSPIYDRHVASFFNETPPNSKEAKNPKDLKDLRIKWFKRFLDRIASSYKEWAEKPEVDSILKQFKARDPALADCNVIRLLDFLVWKVGNAKLLKE